MAYGIAEHPGRSPVAQLDEVEFPVWKDLLVQIAADNGASGDVINLFKSLPRERYQSKNEVLRDLAEAARRVGMGNRPADAACVRDRPTIRRDHDRIRPPVMVSP